MKNSSNCLSFPSCPKHPHVLVPLFTGHERRLELVDTSIDVNKASICNKSHPLTV